jgi:hypothetical protein
MSVGEQEKQENSSLTHTIAGDYPIVATLQSQCVIPHQTSNINLLVQVSITLVVPVHTELVGSANINIHDTIFLTATICHYLVA